MKVIPWHKSWEIVEQLVGVVGLSSDVFESHDSQCSVKSLMKKLTANVYECEAHSLIRRVMREGLTPFDKRWHLVRTLLKRIDCIYSYGDIVSKVKYLDARPGLEHWEGCDIM